jgi:hypothetical protein
MTYTDICMERQPIDDLIQELKQLKVREKEIIQLISEHEKESTEFEVGDRIRILNRIRKPKSWHSHRVWCEDEARLAIVTCVDNSSQKIHFITDNGVNTWRKGSNLLKISR